MDDGRLYCKGDGGDGQIRAFAANTRGVVETARAAHNTQPCGDGGAGTSFNGGSMMGVMMKGDKDLLTLQIKAGGTSGGNHGDSGFQRTE